MQGKHNRWRWWGFCVLGVGLSCLTSSCWRIVIPTFPHQIAIRMTGQSHPMLLQFYEEDHAWTGTLVVLLREAMEKAQHWWGPLEHPVYIRIFPTHESLEQAVNRQYKWLRAWAMFDQLYIQAPRTWLPQQRRSLPKLLIHELTHVLMFQRCGDAHNWHQRPIPIWFLEGMASVTAAQGTWRLSRLQLRELLQSDWGKLIWKDPARYVGIAQREVYSLAHWMFADLLRWCGSPQIQGIKAVRELLQQMKQGQSFPVALKTACGFSLPTFQNRFMQQLSQER